MNSKKRTKAIKSYLHNHRGLGKMAGTEHPLIHNKPMTDPDPSVRRAARAKFESIREESNYHIPKTALVMRMRLEWQKAAGGITYIFWAYRNGLGVEIQGDVRGWDIAGKFENDRTIKGKEAAEEAMIYQRQYLLKHGHLDTSKFNLVDYEIVKPENLSNEDRADFEGLEPKDIRKAARKAGYKFERGEDIYEWAAQHYGWGVKITARPRRVPGAATAPRAGLFDTEETRRNAVEARSQSIKFTANKVAKLQHLPVWVIKDEKTYKKAYLAYQDGMTNSAISAAQFELLATAIRLFEKNHKTTAMAVKGQIEQEKLEKARREHRRKVKRPSLSANQRRIASYLNLVTVR